MPIPMSVLIVLAIVIILLIILLGDLLYADLVKEKELLDQVPNGH